MASFTTASLRRALRSRFVLFLVFVAAAVSLNRAMHIAERYVIAAVLEDGHHHAHLHDLNPPDADDEMIAASVDEEDASVDEGRADDVAYRGGEGRGRVPEISMLPTDDIGASNDGIIPSSQRPASTTALRSPTAAQLKGPPELSTPTSTVTADQPSDRSTALFRATRRSSVRPATTTVTGDPTAPPPQPSPLLHKCDDTFRGTAADDMLLSSNGRIDEAPDRYFVHRAPQRGSDASNVARDQRDHTFGCLRDRPRRRQRVAEEAHFHMCSEPIDAVYTWVNGSDPRQLAHLARWKAIAALDDPSGAAFSVRATDKATGNGSSALYDWSEGGTNSSSTITERLTLPPDQVEQQASVSRFEDHDELLYSLRSLERFAGWVRHVYIVTNGQVPTWLNTSHPRVTVVTHAEIFPDASHLPTFSSPAIEAHLHRIPGLSRRFLYLNDDTFFGAPITPDDYFSATRGFRIYFSWPVPTCAEGCPHAWLADGYCDMKCNTTDCDWDGGDCVGPNVKLADGAHPYYPPTGGAEGGLTAPGDNPPAKGVIFDIDPSVPAQCAVECSTGWIGDQSCDVGCNVPACAYDASDCGDPVTMASSSSLLELSIAAPQHILVNAEGQNDASSDRRIPSPNRTGGVAPLPTTSHPLIGYSHVISHVTLTTATTTTTAAPPRFHGVWRAHQNASARSNGGGLHAAPAANDASHTAPDEGEPVAAARVALHYAYRAPAVSTNAFFLNLTSLFAPGFGTVAVEASRHNGGASPILASDQVWMEVVSAIVRDKHHTAVTTAVASAAGNADERLAEAATSFSEPRPGDSLTQFERRSLVWYIGMAWRSGAAVIASIGSNRTCLGMAPRVPMSCPAWLALLNAAAQPKGRTLAMRWRDLPAVAGLLLRHDCCRPASHNQNHSRNQARRGCRVGPEEAGWGWRPLGNVTAGTYDDDSWVATAVLSAPWRTLFVVVANAPRRMTMLARAAMQRREEALQHLRIRDAAHKEAQDPSADPSRRHDGHQYGNRSSNRSAASGRWHPIPTSTSRTSPRGATTDIARGLPTGTDAVIVARSTDVIQRSCQFVIQGRVWLAPPPAEATAASGQATPAWSPSWCSSTECAVDVALAVNVTIDHPSETYRLSLQPTAPGLGRTGRRQVLVSKAGGNAIRTSNASLQGLPSEVVELLDDPEGTDFRTSTTTGGTTTHSAAETRPPTTLPPSLDEALGQRADPHAARGFRDARHRYERLAHRQRRHQQSGLHPPGGAGNPPPTQASGRRLLSAVLPEPQLGAVMGVAPDHVIDDEATERPSSLEKRRERKNRGNIVVLHREEVVARPVARASAVLGSNNRRGLAAVSSAPPSPPPSRASSWPDEILQWMHEAEDQRDEFSRPAAREAVAGPPRLPAAASPSRSTNRRLLDMFGDSLKYGNSLMTRKFGSALRKVPAHMVHLIDRDVVDELWRTWPEQWNATSASKFRSKRNMQYAFTHFYYIIHAKRNLSVQELFREWLDINGDGELNGPEIRRVALMLWEKKVPYATLETSLHESGVHVETYNGSWLTGATHLGSSRLSEEEEDIDDDGDGDGFAESSSQPVNDNTKIVVTGRNPTFHHRPSGSNESGGGLPSGSDLDIDAKPGNHSSQDDTEAAPTGRLVSATEGTAPRLAMGAAGSQRAAKRRRSPPPVQRAPPSPPRKLSPDEIVNPLPDAYYALVAQLVRAARLNATVHDQEAHPLAASRVAAAVGRYGNRSLFGQNWFIDDEYFPSTSPWPAVSKAFRLEQEGHMGATRGREAPPSLTADSFNATSALASLLLIHYTPNRFKHELMSQDDITFFMVKDNFTVVRSQMDHILWKRPKFLCINDNMNHSHPDNGKIVGVIQELLRQYYPVPSSFELAEGGRNDFVWLDEQRRPLFGKPSKTEGAAIPPFPTTAGLEVAVTGPTGGSLSPKPIRQPSATVGGSSSRVSSKAARTETTVATTAVVPAGKNKRRTVPVSLPKQAGQAFLERQRQQQQRRVWIELGLAIAAPAVLVILGVIFVCFCSPTTVGLAAGHRNGEARRAVGAHTP